MEEEDGTCDEERRAARRFGVVGARLKNAEERICLIEDELRRTRIEAERYRGGWLRMSS
ncbi:hypothetical protein ACHAW5_006571, partial [Stephanodiscus triporus]